MHPGNRHEAGFTFVTLLFAIVVVGIGLAAVGQQASEANRREQEHELITDGLSVIAAVRSYYYSSPGAVRTLPKTWDDLLEDKRFVSTRRHLRRVPLDPFSHTSEWGEIRDPDGSLVGISSKSNKTPFRSIAIVDGPQTIPVGGRYSDWQFRFIVEPGTQ